MSTDRGGILKPLAPSPTEGVMALLQEWQHPVYNVCYQVLRHAQDAEDAAQEVLVKLARSKESSGDIQRLDRWIYRVALNTALNVRKRRATRTFHELRRADVDQAPRPAPGLSEALHDAIADLDDDSRSLVLEHYFDRRSLQDLAKKRDCAVVTVWKKIDRAKSELRRILHRPGFSIAMADVDRALQSIVPVAAPPNLLSEVLLAKISRAAAGGSTIVGGIAMTAKSLSLGAIVGVSVLLFGVGFGGGLLRGASAPEPSPAPPPRADLRGRGLEGRETAAASSDPVRRPAPLTTVGSPPADTPRLQRKLERFREMLLEGRRVGELGDRAHTEEFYRHVNEEWRGLQGQVIADPKTYYNFLRSQPDVLFSELLILLVGHGLGYQSSGGGQSELAPPLVPGLKDLLRSGTEDQRRAFLERGVIALRGASRAELLEQCWSCLRTEPSPPMRAALLDALAQDCSNQYDEAPAGAAKPDDHLGLLEAAWASGEQKASCLFLLSRMRGAAAERLFLEKSAEVARGGDPELLDFLPQPLELRVPLVEAADESRFLSLISEAAAATKNPATFLSLAKLLPSFPLGKASSALESLLAIGPDAESRAAIGRVLERIRAGETRPDVLRRCIR
jgi:RNA polymerase sigma-70 factor (ECF subfamily)